MNKAILFAFFAPLALSASAAPKPAPQPVKAAVSVETQKLEAARQVVLDVLKDPESARFKPLYVAADGETICGAVNAKSSMGGYVGFNRFMLEPGGRLFFDDSGPSFPGLIDMACKR